MDSIAPRHHHCTMKYCKHYQTSRRVRAKVLQHLAVHCSTSFAAVFWPLVLSINFTGAAQGSGHWLVAGHFEMLCCFGSIANFFGHASGQKIESAGCYVVRLIVVRQLSKNILPDARLKKFAIFPSLMLQACVCVLRPTRCCLIRLAKQVLCLSCDLHSASVACSHLPCLASWDRHFPAVHHGQDPQVVHDTSIISPQCEN